MDLDTIALVGNTRLAAAGLEEATAIRLTVRATLDVIEVVGVLATTRVGAVSGEGVRVAAGSGTTIETVVCAADCRRRAWEGTRRVLGRHRTETSLESLSVGLLVASDRRGHGEDGAGGDDEDGELHGWLRLFELFKRKDSGFSRIGTGEVVTKRTDYQSEAGEVG